MNRKNIRSNTDSKLIHSFKGLLMFSGIFNILAATLFIFPQTFRWYLKLLNDINASLNLGGLPLSIPFDPSNSVFINTVGITIVLIGAIMIYCYTDPEKHIMLALLNGIARIFYPFIILYYVINDNLAKIMLGFGFMDLTIGIGFLYFLVRLYLVHPAKKELRNLSNYRVPNNRFSHHHLSHHHR